jgi:hypothetical protein
VKEYTLAQINACLDELRREAKEQALAQMHMTRAAIAAALSKEDVAGKVTKALSDE